MRRLAAIVTLFGALLLAGCGGGGGGGGTAGNGVPGGTLEGEGNAPPPGPGGSPAEREAALSCGNFPLSVLASQYGVKATPEAVAEAVSKDYAAADQEGARKACLDALGER
jgi:hypothetical protein